MHEFAERGIASHWKYKSSEKFNSLTWKEYDWLADLVEIIDKNENPDDSYEYTKLQMFQENAFCFTPKGSIIKLPKNATSAVNEIRWLCYRIVLGHEGSETSPPREIVGSVETIRRI